ncbi:twin-arginine translocase subunit TatC [Trichlorobacter ammonificans]|uniref:Sec-independent protein translocase protein TatC n=1 Tax=Trichlorobacter ammonificans TaxID=2916410 RepID=A0ABN8HL71_9BACT|nr:twin-arginine translocase subunit TatC [Trichlorobacter ammonificans]CAH2032384.1 Sec-independent protein translocase protein TatC [Trichlorobacter ammonificans]
MSAEEPKVLPFIEHLVELRRRLIIIVIAVFIGMGVSWNLANEILVYMEKPLTSVTYIDAAKQKLYRYLQTNYPAIYRMGDMEKELNKPKKQHALNYTKPLEPFFIQCKISAIAGFVLALPIVFHQIWAFVAPGLTRRERKLVVPFMLVGTLAFCLGAFFFLTTVWPFIINFSLSYETEGLRSWLSLSAYVDFCLRLILMFGLMAELPVLTLLLSRFGLVSYAFLAPKRKYALLASSIVAAFHSDLVTMFVIMIPMYMMYEVSVWVALFFGKKKTEPPPLPAAG